MGLFSFLTDAYFSTGSGGETILRWWSPFPRAYIVPDEVTKRRLSTRLATAQIATLLLIACIWGDLWRAFADRPSVLVVGVLGIGALSLAGTTLLLAPVLRPLQPLPGAPVMQEQWKVMSERLTYAQLWLRFLGCLGVTAIGVLLSALNTLLLLIGVIDVLVFGGCTVCFAYMLGLKYYVSRR
jgi:hypothetical protein